MKDETIVEELVYLGLLSPTPAPLTLPQERLGDGTGIYLGALGRSELASLLHSLETGELTSEDNEQLRRMILHSLSKFAEKQNDER